VIGFHAIWVWKIIANVYFTMDQLNEDRDTLEDIKFIAGREPVAIFFVVMTFCSVVLFYRTGEADFIHM